ncbi:vitamin K epoxide reductase family protein [Azospirillum sp. SYSU D00513]|uniref:vitamin K epoxide reductase family protein n=1 Tax=Azospirillum sp. SYSU D00513 TaxID=2812561 RepID=UPI001A96B410|nr:vitamin K epoxide reductase family protein [Azospirillum sp. SYSU D00513]
MMPLRRPTPSQLSHELRKANSPHLRRRRWIVGLSYMGATMGQIVALYQLGVLRRLPDPPLDLFDSSRVDASDYAYKRHQTPDGLMMVATYATTALLAGAGGRDRAQQMPWLPIAMAAKALYDAGVTLKLGREEWNDNKALCAYCQTATVASLATAVLALPEATEAVRAMASDRRPADEEPESGRLPSSRQRALVPADLPAESA